MIYLYIYNIIYNIEYRDIEIKSVKAICLQIDSLTKQLGEKDKEQLQISKHYEIVGKKYLRTS